MTIKKREGEEVKRFLISYAMHKRVEFTHVCYCITKPRYNSGIITCGCGIMTCEQDYRKRRQ